MTRLDDPMESVEARIAKAQSLAKAPLTEATLDALLSGLTVRSETLRDAIAAALHSLQATEMLIDRALDVKRPAAERVSALDGLRLLQPDDASRLAPLLKERVVEVREAAAHAFCVFGAASIEAQLIQALADPVADVRYLVVLAVGSLKSEEARHAIAKAWAEEKAPLVRDALQQVQRRSLA